MTLSAPPEQTLREPLDRPVEPPSPILYDDGPCAGVEGPLMPVLTAPDVAIPLAEAP
jgi:hypothetical protein